MDALQNKDDLNEDPSAMLTSVPQTSWKTINAKVRAQEISTLNQRLKLYGFNTLGELVREFIEAKFPPITEDRQIQQMDANIQNSGLQTSVSGSFNPTFYKSVDLDDMAHYYLTVRRLHEHNAKCLVSYFRRYRDAFFGPDPPSVMSCMKPHKRAWIIQSMNHFGKYYFYKTNNPEFKELVAKIIERYSLNVGLNQHQRMYIVDDNYVHDKV